MSPANSPNNEHRFVQLEQRLEKGEGRMDKYDQILSEIVRNQDRHDLMLSTFITEMKELKEKDIDLSDIARVHEANIQEHSQRWSVVMNAAKWLLGLLVSVGLLFLGSYLSHLVK